MTSVIKIDRNKKDGAMSILKKEFFKNLKLMSFDINGFLIFHEFWSQQSDLICLQSIFSVKERDEIDMSLS